MRCCDVHHSVCFLPDLGNKNSTVHIVRLKENYKVWVFVAVVIGGEWQA